MRRLSLVLAVAPALSLGCASSTAAPTPPAKPKPAVQLVSATIVTNGCATLGAANARMAEDAMHKLVEGCSSVPGGQTEFSVTLMPGGRISLLEGPSQPVVIPTCVLHNELRHKIYLQKPCSLDVKLSEASMALAATDASAPIADAATRDH